MTQEINFQPIFDYIDEKHSEITERFDRLENCKNLWIASLRLLRILEMSI
jgi:hypothetical protein